MLANRFFLAFALGVSLPLLAPAAEPPSPTGGFLDTGRHVFHSVQIIRVTSTHLVFRHSRGIASLPISQLPPDVRIQIEGRIPAVPAPSPRASGPAAPPPDSPAVESMPSPPPPAEDPENAAPAPPARPPAAPASRPPAASQHLRETPRAPKIRPATVWVILPLREHCPSPLGTGTFPGPRGLPFNWFHVHPCVYPQTLVNPEWRRLAERDFFITAARHDPALLTRHILSGW